LTIVCAAVTPILSLTTYTFATTRTKCLNVWRTRTVSAFCTMTSSHSICSSIASRDDWCPLCVRVSLTFRNADCVRLGSVRVLLSVQQQRRQQHALVPRRHATLEGAGAAARIETLQVRSSAVGGVCVCVCVCVCGDVRACSYAVDVWSAGCTFLGMLYRRPHFFSGLDNQHQIVLIVEMLGTAALDNYIAKYKVPIDKTWCGCVCSVVVLREISSCQVQQIRWAVDEEVVGVAVHRRHNAILRACARGIA
jgi:hypothetical protein